MDIILEKIKNSCNLENKNSAFDVLSGVIILKKSVVSVFSNNWIKSQNHDGKYRNNPSDGKIDLIDITVDPDNRKIIVSFIQVQDSTDGIKNDKIKHFVDSASDYFINDREIVDTNYEALKEKQNEFRCVKAEYPTYSCDYKFYLSYRGVDERSEKLEQCVNSLNLPNTNFYLYNNEKINSGLSLIKEKSVLPVDVELNVSSVNTIIEAENAKFDSYTILLDSAQVKNIIDVEQENNIELNRLFNNNVRGFLEDSSINEQIKETISKYSDSFYYCNNGATIFCDQIRKESDSTIHIKNPRIINGQQSIASIYLYDKGNKVSILAKFISVKDENKKDEMMNLLCRTTNTSNQIKPINLISNSKLVYDTKELFKCNNIGLNIKEGALLNNIFVENSDIDLEELLKIWATLYMNRPDYAKAKGKVVKIFYNAEIGDEKYKILKEEKSVAILKGEFLSSYSFYITVKDLVETLNVEEYYTHGFYFILYLIYNKYGINPDVSQIDINYVTSTISKLLNKYKTDMANIGKSYSLNNYFKGTRPMQDLGITIQKESDLIEKFSKKI